MKKQPSTLLCATITYLCILILFVAVRIVVQVVDINFDATIFDVITTTFVQFGIMFCLSVFMFSLLRKQKPKITFADFGYNKIGALPLIVAIFIGISCYFLNLSISSFFGSLIRMFGYESSPGGAAAYQDYSVWGFLLNVFLVAFLPALCEETAHRGLLLKGMSSLGIKKAIILSSLLFGLMHLNVNQFFYATVLGFIIALTVIISKNIFPAMIIHFMNNFLSLYFSYAKANGWAGRGIYDFFTSFLYSDNFISFFITNCLVLCVLLFTIVYLFTILLKSTRIKKVQKMLKDIEQINKEYSNDNKGLQKDANMANLYNLNSLMTQYNIKSLNSMVFTDLEIKSKKPTSYEKLLLWGTFALGIMITIFTFIWGVI